MVYADLLEKEVARSEYLVVMKPARRVTTFTVFSGNVYSAPFDYGQVISVQQDGSEMVEQTTTSLSSGEFYYDLDNETLYVRSFDSTNPNPKQTIATYELYAGTFDAHFNRLPTDNTTRVVYYEPIVKTSPLLKATNSDSIFGVLPVQRTRISLLNAPHILERHLYDSSFNKRRIDVYHWIDTLETDNVKKVMSGIMDSITYRMETTDIGITDRIDELTAEFRPPGSAFYSTALFSELDPAFVGKPIRYVYGAVDGYVPVNLDYKAETPTTSDNRVWGVRADKTKTNEITQTVAVSPVSTTTRIYLNSTAGLRVADTVLVNKTTDESVTITAVTSTYIDITPALVSGVPVNPDTVLRGTVGSVTIFKDDLKYNALFGRDYTMNTSLAGDVLGFTFAATLEANLGMASNLQVGDRVFCRIYGKQNDVIMNAVPFGLNDNSTGNLTAPAPILFDLMVYHLGISESDIDTASFSAVHTETTEALSFAIPSDSNSDFPKYRQIVQDIIQTLLLRLYLNDDSNWAISRYKPIVGTPDKSVDKQEYIKGSLSYILDYREILSDIFVEYAFREVSDDIKVSGPAPSRVTATSNTAKYLHLVSKQKTFPSLHLNSSDAQVLADRLAAIFGERSGVFSFTAKKRFFDEFISNSVRVNSEYMPGFEVVRDVERTRDFVIIDIDRNLRQIDLNVDDQKGAQDNSGLW